MRSLGRWRWAFGGAAAVVGLSLSGDAAAGVKREGEWPEQDKAVSLELLGVPRNEALKRLAGEAGWSLIVNAPAGDPVDVHVKGQPAEKVLEVLLADGDYVAHRDGALISIARQGPSPVPTAAMGPVPPAPPVPPVPPVPALEAAGEPQGAADAAKADTDDIGDEDEAHDKTKKRGRNRVVAGSSLRIEKDEVVRDVQVMGGSLEVLGTVTGDIEVAGGSTTVRSGARVHGDVQSAGGSVTIEDGARVDGDIEVVGGALTRGTKAIVGGDVNTDRDREPEESESTIGRLASDAGDAVTRMAMLFMLGAVLLALAPGRMDTLKVAIAARPMKSFALGIVGSIAAVAVLVALTVTVIGIPVAIVGALLAPLAVFAGACSVLETAGAGLVGHRSKSPYVHLAVGCAGLLVLGSIPYVGGVLWAAVLLIGIGAMVGTRAAGLVKPRAGAAVAASHPFRSMFG